MADLLDKVIIITGSSSGIGAVCAVTCARQGAKIVLCGRDEQRLLEVASTCTQHTSSDRVHYVIGSLSDDAVIGEIVTSTIARFGCINGIVMCAGYGTIRDAEYISVNDMRELWQIHIMAPFLMMKLTNYHLSHSEGYEVSGDGNLKASLSDSDGRNAANMLSYRVIFVSSLMGFCPLSMSVGYTVTKAAQDQFARLLSKGFVHSIQGNSIRPGWIRTPIIRNTGVIGGDYTASVVFRVMEMLTPAKRCGSADEVAEYVAFVLGDQCGLVTGQNLLIDGGEVLPYCYNPRCTIL